MSNMPSNKGCAGVAVLTREQHQTSSLSGVKMNSRSMELMTQAIMFCTL